MSHINRFGEIEETTCPSCGSPIKPEWVACPHCGNPIGSVCLKCKKPIKPEWKACPNCGTEIERKESSDSKKAAENNAVLEDVILWLRDSDGPELDSSEALEKAEEIVSSLTEKQFSLLKEVYEWLCDELELVSFDALEKAQEIVSPLTKEQFSVLQKAYSVGCGNLGFELKNALSYAVNTAKKKGK